jgi:hypothetical protein
MLIDSQIQHGWVLLCAFGELTKLHRIEHQEDLLFHGIKERAGPREDGGEAACLNISIL